MAISQAVCFGTTNLRYDQQKIILKGIYLNTRHVCENSSQCLINKSNPNKTASKHIEKKNLAPSEYLTVDVIVKLPRTFDGKFFILTLID